MNLPVSTLSSASLASLWDELGQQSFPERALYVVATPIGNIGDISLRAIRVLSLVDAVGCEDTRNTGQLLARLGLSKPLFSAHQHNERETAQKIIDRLRAGERIALVSDAGTPAVSDPGTRIVDAVRDAGFAVIPVAGPSAAIAALSVSGLATDQFHFIGFLPAKSSQREQVLAGLATSTASLVFYEAPNRIIDAIQALLKAFGPERRIVIAREISKLFEQVHRCRLGDALDWMNADANRQRGEFVLLVEGDRTAGDPGLSEARRVLGALLEALPVSQAAALAAKITGMKKNALYSLALEMRPEDNPD